MKTYGQCTGNSGTQCRAETVTHPKKITGFCLVRRPQETSELEPPPFWKKRRQCSQGRCGTEQSRKRGRMRGGKSKDTDKWNLSQTAKSYNSLRAPHYMRESSFPSQSLCSGLFENSQGQSREWEKATLNPIYSEGSQNLLPEFKCKIQWASPGAAASTTPPHPDICPSGTLNRHLHPNGVKFRLRSEGPLLYMK